MVRLVDVPVNTFVGSLLGTPDPVTDSPGLDGAALGCRRPDKPQSPFWPQSHFGMPSGTDFLLKWYLTANWNEVYDVLEYLLRKHQVKKIKPTMQTLC